GGDGRVGAAPAAAEHGEGSPSRADCAGAASAPSTSAGGGRATTAATVDTADVGGCGPSTSRGGATATSAAPARDPATAAAGTTHRRRGASPSISRGSPAGRAKDRAQDGPARGSLGVRRARILEVRRAGTGDGESASSGAGGAREARDPARGGYVERHLVAG